MEDIKNIVRIHKVFISKKTINNIKKKKKSKKNISKDSITFENSTDLSSNNIISLEEKSDIILKVPNLDDIVIPSFLNDIPKNNKINKDIENYYKYQKLFDSPEMAKVYLVDVKRLYEQKKKNNDKF